MNFQLAVEQAARRCRCGASWSSSSCARRWTWRSSLQSSAFECRCAACTRWQGVLSSCAAALAPASTGAAPATQQRFAAEQCRCPGCSSCDCADEHGLLPCCRDTSMHTRTLGEIFACLQDTIDRIASLEATGTLTGIMDDRGKVRRAAQTLMRPWQHSGWCLLLACCSCLLRLGCPVLHAL